MNFYIQLTFPGQQYPRVAAQLPGSPTLYSSPGNLHLEMNGESMMNYPSKSLKSMQSKISDWDIHVDLEF